MGTVGLFYREVATKFSQAPYNSLLADEKSSAHYLGKSS